MNSENYFYNETQKRLATAGKVMNEKDYNETIFQFKLKYWHLASGNLICNFPPNLQAKLIAVLRKRFEQRVRIDNEKRKSIKENKK